MNEYPSIWAQENNLLMRRKGGSHFSITEQKNAMVSFAKIEHAKRVKEENNNNKITRALLSFAFPQLDGPRKSSTFPPFFSGSNAKDSVFISFLSLKSPAEES